MTKFDLAVSLVAELTEKPVDSFGWILPAMRETFGEDLSSGLEAEISDADARKLASVFREEKDRILVMIVGGIIESLYGTA